MTTSLQLPSAAYEAILRDALLSSLVATTAAMLAAHARPSDNRSAQIAELAARSSATSALLSMLPKRA